MLRNGVLYFFAYTLIHCLLFKNYVVTSVQTVDSELLRKELFTQFLQDLASNPLTQTRFALQFAIHICRLLGKQYNRGTGDCIQPTTVPLEPSAFSIEAERKLEKTLGAVSSFYAGDYSHVIPNEVTQKFIQHVNLTSEDPLQLVIRLMSGEESSGYFPTLFIHRTKHWICRLFFMEFDNETGECVHPIDMILMADPSPLETSVFFNHFTNDIFALNEHLGLRIPLVFDHNRNIQIKGFNMLPALIDTD